MNSKMKGWGRLRECLLQKPSSWAPHGQLVYDPNDACLASLQELYSSANTTITHFITVMFIFLGRLTQVLCNTSYHLIYSNVTFIPTNYSRKTNVKAQNTLGLSAPLVSDNPLSLINVTQFLSRVQGLQAE